MQTEQKEHLVGLPDCIRQWAQVNVPVLPSTPSWEGQSLQWRPQPAPGFPFGRMPQDTYCLFFPGALMPTHPPVVVGSSRGSSLGNLFFLSFPGEQAGSSCTFSLYRPGMEGCSYSHLVCAAACPQQVRTDHSLSCVHHIPACCSCSNPPVTHPQ